MKAGSGEWFSKEIGEAELGDKRLNVRFKKLLEGLSKKSEASIPSALDSWSESCAAYRFFSNKKV